MIVPTKPGILAANEVMRGDFGRLHRFIKRNAIEQMPRKLRVAMVDKDQNLIGVVGSVPGPRKGIVLLKETK